MFNIPIVIFIFRRQSGLPAIIERIKEVKPTKVYIIADGPRNEEEKNETNKCRDLIEELIDWKCQIIKNYSCDNRGVFCNIGLGAKWVFEREETAIFIEDDNLPEITFFYYCRELLERYRDNEKILWICGTNYLGKYNCTNSYMFTQHLLPCGWASWGKKFIAYYDGYLETLEDEIHIKNYKSSYRCKALCKQQLYSINRTHYLLQNNISKSSWDYQMLFSIRSKDLFGISPCCNQIKNIGVDNFSEHGGNNWKSIMTKRFCGMSSYKLEFPLKHPQLIEKDVVYEKELDKVILQPLKERLKQKIARILKKFLGLKPYDSMAEYIKRGKNGRNIGQK